MVVPNDRGITEVPYRIGEIVEGIVTRSPPYGVFVNIGEPVDAFVDLAYLPESESGKRLFPSRGERVTGVVAYYKGNQVCLSLLKKHLDDPGELGMDVLERRDFINSMHDACGHAIAASTIAFFGVVDSTGIPNHLRGVPQHLGSGVLLEVGLRKFIVTAAHNMDIASRDDVAPYIGGAIGGSQAVGLASDMIVSSAMPESGDRADDLVDVAVVLLRDDVVADMPTSKKYLHLADLDPQDVPEQGNWYFVLGMPSEWSTADPTTKAVRSTLFPFGGVTYQGDRGALENFTQGLHIGIDFNPHHNIDPNGDRKSVV